MTYQILTLFYSSFIMISTISLTPHSSALHRSSTVCMLMLSSLRILCKVEEAMCLSLMSTYVLTFFSFYVFQNGAWYVGGANSDRTVTLKKSVKSYTGSTVSPGTSSCMKTDGTATLGETQKLYYYSRCYKVKTTTVTNYFERWSSWSSWGDWTTKESTDEYKNEDTTKMYYVVCN